MSSRARNDRRHLEGEPSDVDTAAAGTQLHLVFRSPARDVRRNPFAPKLTIDQRREAVRMRIEGASWNAVAQRFGVRPRSVEHLVHCGRYGRIPDPVSHVELASPPSESAAAGKQEERAMVEHPRRRATRKGVDLIIRGLPLENHRTLEVLAAEAGCSVADFTLDLLACAAPPTAADTPEAIQRVGLRHLVSTWRNEP